MRRATAMVRKVIADAERPDYAGQEGLAVGGETVILLHPALHLVGVSIVMERERQQNDSLANGYRKAGRCGARPSVIARRLTCAAMLGVRVSTGIIFLFYPPATFSSSRRLCATVCAWGHSTSDPPRPAVACRLAFSEATGRRDTSGWRKCTLPTPRPPG